MMSGCAIVVTGSKGFIGAHLVGFLRASGWEVHRCDLDVRDDHQIWESYFRGLNSAHVILIHLAGMSFVPDCENKPELAMAINRDGARVVSEAFYRSIPRGLIVFASTAQVYSAPIGDEVIADEGRVLPWAEDRQLLPQNVYARSKLEGEAAVRDVAGALGRSAVVLRLFNHVHNTQSERFFLPSVYGQLLGFQRSSALNRKLVVGNLEIKRDIGSIQDLLSAFHAVLLNVDSVKGVEVFNICSGVAKGLDRLVRLLAARMGLEIEIEVDESRFRRGEPKVILGSHEKISALTGWTPSAVSEDVLLDAFLAKIEF